VSRIGAVTLAVAITLAGCGDQAPRSRLTVLAAASLAEAFADFAVGTKVTYSFAGSQQLVAQVEAGAPADVVATADWVPMDRMLHARLVEAPHVFARNRLAIAVRAGNPERIRSLADLARPGLRLALADPAVPAGRYAAEVLEKAAVTVRPVSLELDVKAVVARVASGEAHAGIVYVTDARNGQGVEGVDIPEAANVTATYPVAVVKASRDIHAARAFVDRLLDHAGRDALAANGFLLP
jgi:molybdate transport system substrate-binding protein